MRDGPEIALDVYFSGGPRPFPAFVSLSSYGKTAMTLGAPPSYRIPHAVDRRPKTLTIHQGEDHPSWLLLPVVEGNLIGTSSWMRPGFKMPKPH